MKAKQLDGRRGAELVARRDAARNKRGYGVVAGVVVVIACGLKADAGHGWQAKLLLPGELMSEALSNLKARVAPVDKCPVRAMTTDAKVDWEEGETFEVETLKLGGSKRDGRLQLRPQTAVSVWLVDGYKVLSCSVSWELTPENGWYEVSNCRISCIGDKQKWMDFREV